jgi:hypothetical protein
MAETEGNIGSLWVSLGVDTSQLNQGMRQAEQQAVSAATRISQRIGAMTSGVKGFAASWMALPMAIASTIFSVQQVAQEFQKFYGLAKEGAKAMRLIGCSLLLVGR